MTSYYVYGIEKDASRKDIYRTIAKCDAKADADAIAARYRFIYGNVIVSEALRSNGGLPAIDTNYH